MAFDRQRLRTALLLGVAGSFAGLALPAQAQWNGHLAITSDQISRGQTQSDREPSASALLGWRLNGGSFSGLYASLAAARVSDKQFTGSSGVSLTPEIGWARGWGEEQSEGQTLQTGVLLRSQTFPGARGTWTGTLPDRAADGRPFTQLQPQVSNYTTTEAGVSLGWQGESWLATLSYTRSLSNYLGLAATETSASGGTRELSSKGTGYVALDLQWPLNPTWALVAGVGRLSVPNFPSVGYTDWRLGANAQAWGLSWALVASGSNANTANWQPRRVGNSSAQEGDRSTAIQASVRWSF